MQSKKYLKKASSLIEVIIVLAIVSFTIIAAMSLVARTRLEIKNNELQDTANELLLKALEGVKSPSKTVISGSPSLTGSNPYYFSLTQSVNGNYVLNYLGATGFTPLPRESGKYTFDSVCNANSPFYPRDLGDSTFKYCQQVAITVITPILRAVTAKELYKIETTIVYQISGETKSETLTTYRYDGFKKIPQN